MAAVTGYGFTPAGAPFDPVLAYGILMERAGQDKEHAKALKMAPAMSTGGLLDGLLPVDNTRVGLDLVANPTIMTPISRTAGAEAYSDVRDSIDKISISLSRYQIGRRVLIDKLIANLDKAVGTSWEARVMKAVSRNYADMATKSILDTAFAAGSYVTACKTSGGDVTAAGYDFASDLLDARVALIKTGRWGNMVATFARDLVNTIVTTNTALRYFATTTGAPGAPNEGLFVSYVKHIIGDDVDVQISDYVYTATSGTVTFGATAAWNIVLTGGEEDASAFRLLNPGTLLDIESERSAASKGTVIYPDAWWQVLPTARAVDAAATAETDAGFLHYGYVVDQVDTV